MARFFSTLAALTLFLSLVRGQDDYKLNDLPSCATADSDDGPCILRNGIFPANATATGDLMATAVMVTSSTCKEHPGGALIGVERLNEMDFRIGFYENHLVKFRFLHIEAGNPTTMSSVDYDRQHQGALRAALEGLKNEYHFIIGTCSQNAHNEKELAREYQTILMAQVGPPSFYRDDNPWLFGIHISSDSYALDTVRQLKFLKDSKNEAARKQDQQQQVVGAGSPTINVTGESDTIADTDGQGLTVAVMYRTKSEFFDSTCRAAVAGLRRAGFDGANLLELSYDPDADHNGDGVPNSRDDLFLRGLADQACPPDRISANDFHPAIFMCTIGEQVPFLERFRENGCRPSSLWMTPATWTWAQQFPEFVKYVQGGGQWHPAFEYSDRFFDSGREFLQYGEERFGDSVTYNTLVSYSIPLVFADHLVFSYRTEDDPTPLSDFLDPKKREQLRRIMLNIQVDTLFGSLLFDHNQRNAGRGSATTQWLPSKDGSSSFYNALVAPLSDAEEAFALPASSAKECIAGEYVNISKIQAEPSLLTSKCSPCPMDTFAPFSNEDDQCQRCPPGSTTEGLIGSTACTAYDDNLLSLGVFSFGYFMMATSLLLSFGFLVWTICCRQDPVVRLGQFEFLVLICIGGIISTTSILGLSTQAGSNEDISNATIGCQTIPFLYTFGWTLQNASLAAKTIRLSRIVDNPKLKRVKAPLWHSLFVVALWVILDMIIVTAWTILSPLEYKREVIGQEIDDHVLTIQSTGRCRSSEENPSVWYFVVPLICIHVFLLFATHWFLHKVRGVSHRYQEQRFIRMASFFALEVFVLGIPTLAAANDSLEATYFVIVAIVALDNIGVMCFIFVPKVTFQRQGLEEGVGVAESIMATSHTRAQAREITRSSFYVSTFSTAENVPRHAMPSYMSTYDVEEMPIAEDEDEDDNSGSEEEVVDDKSSENASTATTDPFPRTRTSSENNEKTDDEVESIKDATKSSPVRDSAGPRWTW